MIYFYFNGFANKLVKHCCATPMIKSNILNECIYIILVVFSLNVIAKIFLKISFGSFNDSNPTCVFFSAIEILRHIQPTQKLFRCVKKPGVDFSSSPNLLFNNPIRRVDKTKPNFLQTYDLV